ncbi:hypothetical protein Poli38472_000256 [Pythium oligandrum]|uniref:MYND-type domain-containing protein n=1 Tax=Pythium oligandrum TaxID=41045 RepID=A0A8K1CBX8_PYTOL|nr:hypothetical protein Poli38472_000256 [Pythium oligandrum]|eukprot:TMW60214.1 hypothetical protein Poli38472_000256 [Pythium oligandrum]
MAEEVLACARYGELEELQELLKAVSVDEKDSYVNYVQPDTLNTPLHMACANGHADCAKELIAHGARHIANASGNTPLHWAVQNNHLAAVKALLEGIPDIDVLAQNGFGRGCVTEAFSAQDTEILGVLLEHKSASEERLAEGSGMENAKIREELDETDDEESKSGSNEPKIVQEMVLEFGFDKSLPTLKARELALDWNKDVFGTTAEEDITGVSIWSASLILSRWIIDNADMFANKQVCELGAGCGVSGLASYLYTKASRVVLSDLFEHTIKNLEYNVALNKTTTASIEPEQEDADDEERGCDQCGVMQKFSADNPDGKLMKCGGCRTTQYCSRQCQKKAWKEHKTECKRIRAERDARTATQRSLDVAAIDWAKRETWPQLDGKPSPFDVLIGSDLVYHREIVPVLVNAVDGLLAPNSDAKFIHVASQARDSLIEFKDAMEARGFTCDVQFVPESYKTNPLVGNESVVELFDLHFNEMSDVYCLYTFTRKV